MFLAIILPTYSVSDTINMPTYSILNTINESTYSVLSFISWRNLNIFARLRHIINYFEDYHSQNIRFLVSLQSNKLNAL